MRKTLFTVLLLAVTYSLSPAQIPSKPSPPRLVNDLAGLFTSQQVAALEHHLVAFSDTTSNQVVVLTVNDLNGYSAAQFAYEVGQQWSVGQEAFNNGVVILIKPKAGNSRGQAFIATGYGVEGVLPDATCTSIVNNEMIPHFLHNDYYRGVVAAVDVILPILAGEYSYKYYNENGYVVILIVALFFGVIIFLIWKKGGRRTTTFSGSGYSNNVLKGVLLGGMLSGGGQGYFGGSSWGGSSGGFGGFGGFGGGSFGGGGGGGSW